MLYILLGLVCSIIEFQQPALPFIYELSNGDTVSILVCPNGERLVSYKPAGHEIITWTKRASLLLLNPVDTP